MLKSVIEKKNKQKQEIKLKFVYELFPTKHNQNKPTRCTSFKRTAPTKQTNTLCNNQDHHHCYVDQADIVAVERITFCVVQRIQSFHWGMLLWLLELAVPLFEVVIATLFRSWGSWTCWRKEGHATSPAGKQGHGTWHYCHCLHFKIRFSWSFGSII